LLVFLYYIKTADGNNLSIIDGSICNKVIFTFIIPVT
jgi:hypothetical protein